MAFTKEADFEEALVNILSQRCGWETDVLINYNEEQLIHNWADILFENNRFKDSYGLVAFIASSGNVVFKDNIFENPTSRKLNKPYRGQFYVFSSSNIKIVNNTYVSTPNVKSPGVLADESAKGIVVEGNRIVEPAENSVK